MDGSPVTLNWPPSSAAPGRSPRSPSLFTIRPAANSASRRRVVHEPRTALAPTARTTCGRRSENRTLACDVPADCRAALAAAPSGLPRQYCAPSPGRARAAALRPRANCTNDPQAALSKQDAALPRTGAIAAQPRVSPLSGRPDSVARSCRRTMPAPQRAALAPAASAKKSRGANPAAASSSSAPSVSFADTPRTPKKPDGFA